MQFFLIGIMAKNKIITPVRIHVGNGFNLPTRILDRVEVEMSGFLAIFDFPDVRLAC